MHTRRRLTPEEQRYARDWVERRRSVAISEFRTLAWCLVAVAAILFAAAVWLSL